MMKKFLLVMIAFSSSIAMANEGCHETSSICTVTKEYASWNDFRTVVLKRDGKIVKEYEIGQSDELAVKAALKLEAAKICVYVE